MLQWLLNWLHTSWWTWSLLLLWLPSWMPWCPILEEEWVTQNWVFRWEKASCPAKGCIYIKLCFWLPCVTKLFSIVEIMQLVYSDKSYGKSECGHFIWNVWNPSKISRVWSPYIAKRIGYFPFIKQPFTVVLPVSITNIYMSYPLIHLYPSRPFKKMV